MSRWSNNSWKQKPEWWKWKEICLPEKRKQNEICLPVKQSLSKGEAKRGNKKEKPVNRQRKPVTKCTHINMPEMMGKFSWKISEKNLIHTPCGSVQISKGKLAEMRLEKPMESKRMGDQWVTETEMMMGVLSTWKKKEKFPKESVSFSPNFKGWQGGRKTDLNGVWAPVTKKALNTCSLKKKGKISKYLSIFIKTRSNFKEIGGGRGSKEKSHSVRTGRWVGKQTPRRWWMRGKFTPVKGGSRKKESVYL